MTTSEFREQLDAILWQYPDDPESIAVAELLELRKREERLREEVHERGPEL